MNNKYVILQYLIPTNPRNKNSKHLKKCNGYDHNNIFIKQHLDLLNSKHKSNYSMINIIDDMILIKADKKNNGAYKPKDTICLLFTTETIYSQVFNRYN